MDKYVNIVFYCEDFEDLQRQVIELYRKTGTIPREAVMPDNSQFPGITIAQVLTDVGPVVVRVLRPKGRCHG